MLQPWWNTNMDARRSISLLIAVSGLAVVAIGIAASPVSAFDGNYSGAIDPVLGAVGPASVAALAGYVLNRDFGHARAPLWALAFGATAAVILVAVGPILEAAVGPVFGAATAGYALHRISDHQRAPLWALAFGAAAAVILVATFGMAAMIHPTVRRMPGLGDAWYSVIVSGLVVAFVGAFLWKRVAAGMRRLAALGLFGLFLLVGWVISATRGDWGAASQDFLFGASGVAFLALAVSRLASDQDAAPSAT